VLRVRASAGECAYAADGAQHHNCEEDALDTVKPVMADCLGLLGERRETAGCIEEAGEPCQPQQRPAVKPLETKIGDGFGDKAHGPHYTLASTRSNWTAEMPLIFGVRASVFKQKRASDSAELASRGAPLRHAAHAQAARLSQSPLSLNRGMSSFLHAATDRQALVTLHDMLRYVERELRFLDAPTRDAAADVGHAANTVKAAMRKRAGKRA